MNCFKQGAAKFGWEKRKMEPRSMREGNWLVGWGTATGTWGAYQMPASIKDRFSRRRNGECRKRDRRHRTGNLYGHHDDCR